MEYYDMQFFQNNAPVHKETFCGANRFCAEYEADEFCREQGYDSFINLGKRDFSLCQ